MQVQNQVARTLRANLSRLREVLDSTAARGIKSIGRIADSVCEAFGFRDGRGVLQRASCRQALAELEAAGQVALPPRRRRRGGGRKPRLLAQPVAAAHAVPTEVGAAQDLELVLVESDAQRLVWNTLMAHEHPRGAGPWVGPQLRYLVSSAHGWLGGVGFAASARHLQARDAWIGWDDAGRRNQLHRVAGLCRFLIRPGVACRNLASHILGRVIRAVGADFERQYGYRSWLLETFVDESEHAGTSWRAANWVRVGETAGRGRQDRSYAVAETRKAVYMYALEPAWRERLAVPAPVLVPLAPGDGLDAESWAQNEFGGAPLGDARLSARLVASARLLAQAPLRAITGAAKGVRALVKGHYRLIDQPADSEVTVENILKPHRQRTLRRMGAHQMVLCIQDGTLMNFTRRGQTQGLAAIGSNQTGAVARGLHLHTTLAVNPEGCRWACCGLASTPRSRPTRRRPASRRATHRKRARSASRIAGLKVCTTVRRRPRICRIRACCAPWTVKPTSLTCSGSGASTRRRSNCWSVPRSTGCSPRSRTDSDGHPAGRTRPAPGLPRASTLRVSLAHRGAPGAYHPAPAAEPPGTLQRRGEPSAAALPESQSAVTPLPRRDLALGRRPASRTRPFRATARGRSRGHLARPGKPHIPVTAVCGLPSRRARPPARRNPAPRRPWFPVAGAERGCASISRRRWRCRSPRTPSPRADRRPSRPR